LEDLCPDELGVGAARVDHNAYTEETDAETDGENVLVPV